jgi:hypothetical protein
VALRSETRARRRLAADVRRHAGTEAARLKRRGVVDFREISRRAALCELIAVRLEAADVPVEPRGVERIQRLLDEAPRDGAGRDVDVWAPALLALDSELSQQPTRLLRAS